MLLEPLLHSIDGNTGPKQDCISSSNTNMRMTFELKVHYRSQGLTSRGRVLTHAASAADCTAF